jgi:hypothetical protein
MANTFKFGNGNWAVKKDSVLAYNDENDNFKPLPFDFTRDTIGTYVDSDGLIKTASNNEARIDYLDNANGHLLLEPSRTNLILNSEALDSSSYTSGGSGTGSVTVTANYGISPDGTQNADRVQLVQGSSYREFYQRVSVTNGAKYTLSFYAKSLSGTPTLYTVWNNGYENEVTFSTEWVRYEYTFTEDSSSSENISGLNLITWTNLPSTSTSADLLVWGVQLEQASYPTSYIPTNGSSVTRAADSSSQTPPSGIIGQTEGTVYVEFDYLNSTGERRFIFQLTSGSGEIYARIESGQTLTSQILNSGSGLTSQNTAVPSGTNKLAIAYASNDAVIYLNGTQIAVTSSITIPSLSDVYIGANSAGGQQISGINKEFKLYNTRLSNAELITLTQV